MMKLGAKIFLSRLAGLFFVFTLFLNQVLGQTHSIYSDEGKMYVGVDYYPEHWPEERVDQDIKLMKEAGFNLVRMAEFAWVKMEPSEGVYDFGWLDKVIDKFQQQGIKVILGTPTAVMPAWLARKYPAAMATNDDGSQIDWGGRKNNCFSDGNYRWLSKRIAHEMSAHYADHPNVIGWQTDNELSGPICHCQRCLANFQDWLKAKYGTLDSLNAAWGNHFWGLTLHSWQEVTFPDCEGDTDWDKIANPSLCLDWKRFHTSLQVDFQRDQVEVIRKNCPEDFITHNMMGLHNNVDYYKLAEDLDFVSWDNYPVWNKLEIPYGSSMAADVMRGLKQKNFWIMEQTAGPVGWGEFARNTRPGELRKICYQQLAHGADAQVWFRWRTSTAGREQYWHGLLGHDGKAGRRYEEAAQVAREYDKLARYLTGTSVDSKVAMLYDYENIWATQNQPGFAGNDVQKAISRYYDALFRRGINVDFLHPDHEFSGYDLVLAPGLHIVSKELAANIEAFVEAGGVFATEYRAAVKTPTNLVYDLTLPGLLREVLGIQIPEYEAMGDFTYRMEPKEPGFKSYDATMYSDWIIPEAAQTLIGYDEWHMKDYAALTRNQFGKGHAWYLGTIVNDPAFYDQLIDKLLADAEIEPGVVLPPGVEASVRQSEQHQVLFLINHTESEVKVKVPENKMELISDRKTTSDFQLEPYGVGVILLE